MITKLLTHAVFAFFFLLYLPEIRTDYSIDSRILAFIFTNVSFLMAFAFKALHKKALVLRLCCSVLIYVLTWWTSLVSLMFLTSALEGIEFVNVYLRNSVSDSRFYFFQMLLLFTLSLVFLEILQKWKNVNKTNVSNERP